MAPSIKILYFLALVLAFLATSILALPLQDEDSPIDSDLAQGFTNIGSFKYIGRNGQAMESTYHLSNGRAWWDTVMAECVASGLGSLLSIESAAEDQAIRELVRKEVYSIWTSGSFEDGISWRWASTNETLEYNNFTTPPTTTTAQRVWIHTSMQDGSYRWFTSAKSVTKKYICEKTTIIAI